MKTIEEMAHEYMIAAIERGFPVGKTQDVVDECFNIAKIMKDKSKSFES